MATVHCIHFTGEERLEFRLPAETIEVLELTPGWLVEQLESSPEIQSATLDAAQDRQLTVAVAGDVAPAYQRCKRILGLYVALIRIFIFVEK